MQGGRRRSEGRQTTWKNLKISLRRATRTLAFFLSRASFSLSSPSSSLSFAGEPSSRQAAHLVDDVELILNELREFRRHYCLKKKQGAKKKNVAALFVERKRRVEKPVKRLPVVFFSRGAPREKDSAARREKEAKRERVVKERESGTMALPRGREAERMESAWGVAFFFSLSVSPFSLDLFLFPLPLSLPASAPTAADKDFPPPLLSLCFLLQLINSKIKNFKPHFTSPRTL